MGEIQRNLEQIWSQLRSQQANRSDILEEIGITGLRGIRDLTIRFSFPVTVLAGPNGCGKSTILFALASAYKVPDVSPRYYTPPALFPEFRPSQTEAGSFHDRRNPAEVRFAFVANNQRIQMRWARASGKWNRSFFGQKRGKQPSRQLYLRTLANLSNPSEVRSVLQLGNKRYENSQVDSAQIALAQRILSFHYSRLDKLVGGKRDLLFAERVSGASTADPVRYSEFHMSAGERAVLRISMALSSFQNGLVLIDEVEAGLHPFVQQMMMLELQRLALRNKLQIVVTTHSPVVLDTVPREARVFLERTADDVIRREPFRDVIQRAMYGVSQNKLSFVCEDEEAEFFIRGLVELLGPKLDFLPNDIEIGRDTGKDEFANHLRAFARIRKLDDIVLVLDGDGRAMVPELEAAAKKEGQVLQSLVLPGSDSPEVWIWDVLKAHPEDHCSEFGFAGTALAKSIAEIDLIYAAATDKPGNIAKNKLHTLCERSAKRAPDLIRRVAKLEADKQRGAVVEVLNALEGLIRDWRSRNLA